MASLKPFVGQLDRRITLFETSKIKNEINEEKETDVVVCRPWAKVDEVSGGEEVEGKILHKTQRSFIVRFRDEINKKSNQLKVDFEGSFYNVTHVKQIGRREYLELQCVIYE